VKRNIKMQTKLPLCDGYRFAVLKKRLHDERAVLRSPVLHGNWNCKTLRFQCYPSHGKWTLRLHILAVQKTSGFTGGPRILSALVSYLANISVCGFKRFFIKGTAKFLGPVQKQIVHVLCTHHII